MTTRGNGNESSWEQPAEHKAWDDRVKAIIASSVANDTSRLNIPPPPPPPPSGTTPGLPKSTPSGTQSQGQILPPNRYQNTSPVVNNIPSVSPNPTTGLPTPAKRTMQIFKNERYSLAPLPAKWSSEALLPSDRMSYSDDKVTRNPLLLSFPLPFYDKVARSPPTTTPLSFPSHLPFLPPYLFSTQVCSYPNLT